MTPEEQKELSIRAVKFLITSTCSFRFRGLLIRMRITYSYLKTPESWKVVLKQSS